MKESFHGSEIEKVFTLLIHGVFREMQISEFDMGKSLIEIQEKFGISSEDVYC